MTVAAASEMKNLIQDRNKVPYYSSKVAVQKIVSNEGNKGALKILEPSWRKLRKKAGNRSDKRGLQISKGERKRRRMVTDLGTDVNRRKGTGGGNRHMMVYRRVEGGDKKGWMVVKVLEPGDVTEEVLA